MIALRRSAHSSHRQCPVPEADRLAGSSNLRLIYNESGLHLADCCVHNEFWSNDCRTHLTVALLPDASSYEGTMGASSALGKRCPGPPRAASSVHLTSSWAWHCARGLALQSRFRALMDGYVCRGNCVAPMDNYLCRADPPLYRGGWVID